MRLSARFSRGSSAPTDAELRAALAELEASLAALVGEPEPATAGRRADRELSELIETYRPRQRELIDLLLEEGELTATEHARLREHLEATAEAGRGRATSGEPPAPRAPAASPAPAPAAGGRPVEELLRAYEITTLRQAGAVRARRQISYDEYMRLKAHFEQAVVARPAAAEDDRRR